MAARLEHEHLQLRKARLIKQNDLHRANLQAEVETLRGAANWVERGFAFYRAAGRLKTWAKPSSRPGKKPGSIGRMLRGCVVGLRLWKNLTQG